MTISLAYAEQNRQLHAVNANYGTTGSQWVGYVESLVRDDGHATVLDWACGKGMLARGLKRVGIDVAEYDPAVPGKEATPEPADLVVATDVLEHIEPEHLDAVLAELARVTKRKLFFDVCTAESLKGLPDGRNPHLIIQPPEWWRYKLTRYFDIVHWVERDELNMFYGEAVPKGQGEAHAEAKAIRPKRRKMSPELSSMCNRILEISESTCDELSRIRSARMYEGAGDAAADLQIVWDLLDDVDDPAAVLKEVAKLANRCIMLRVKLTEDRDEAYWRKLFETFWYIGDWVVDADGLGVMAFPKVSVGGVKVIGAVEGPERWTQIQANIKRVQKRIVPAPAHKKRAIIACYGPSLGSHIDRIKAEMDEADCDVVSVSGAHDFLIDHGITPRYHVECDPRPHKADNILLGRQGVEYLLGSVVSPVLMDKLEGCDISLWHVADQDHARDLLKLGESGKHMISGGGSVGLRACSLFYSLGYRDFSIYAMDCSFADDGQQWAGKHAGKLKDVIQVQCAGHVFQTSTVMLTYATDFIEMVQKMDGQFRVYGDGLLQSMCVLHAQLAERAA